MALRIVFPQSAIIPPNDITTFTLHWEIDEPGQNAYELQYRLKKDKTWSTCGKVYDSEARSCTFESLYNACPVQFYEIIYRLVVYLEGPNIIIDDEGETKDGISHSMITSEAYWVIFRDRIDDWLFKVYMPKYHDSFEYPLFDEITQESHDLAEVDSVNINVGTVDSPKIKRLPLVQLDSPLAGELKVQTPTGTKVAVSEAANAFRPTKFYTYGYIDQYVFDYYTLYKYMSDKYYSYEPVYKYQTVYAYDKLYKDDPHYDYSYDYKIYYDYGLDYYEYSYYKKAYKRTGYHTEYYTFIYYTKEYKTESEAYTAYKYDYSTYKDHYKKSYGPSQYTVDEPIAYAQKYSHTKGIYYEVTAYRRVRPTVEITVYDYTEEIKHYKPYTAYRDISVEYYDRHEETRSTEVEDGYNYYYYIPLDYAPYHYIVYSYDYQESMYCSYRYDYIDYYTRTDTGKYYKYDNYYYEVFVKNIQKYLGYYYFDVVNGYVDVGYSYTYFING